MTSLLRSTREVSNNTGYYIPLADIRTSVLAYNPDSSVQFSTATWANRAADAALGYYSSLVDGAGKALLRDMGRTVVSSTRVFRRIQLVVPVNPSTFGVAGAGGTTYPTTDFLTGYIELGFEGGGSPAKVAVFGR
jgi:hypothetical protein